MKKLNEEKVVEILLSRDSTAELARRFDLDVSTVRQIRTGLKWKSVRPDIQRVKSVAVFHKSRYCTTCIHRLGSKCSLGFPEARKPKFAELCSVYKEKTCD